MEKLRKPLGISTGDPSLAQATPGAVAAKRLSTEVALGLSVPGYDIANLVVAMATGETIVGDSVEGSVAWSMLGAAAVLTVIDPFGSKAAPLKAIEEAVTRGGISETGAKGLARLMDAGHGHQIEPLLKHSEEAADKIGRILHGAESFEVKSAAEANAEFVAEAAANGKIGIPPHHPDLPVIEITKAQEGTIGFLAESAPPTSAEETLTGPAVPNGNWIALIDPRIESKATYKEQMSILDQFGNRMEQVREVDLRGESFTMSIAGPVKEAGTGEYHAGGGLQGMFKTDQKPPARKWSEAYHWIESGK